MGTDGGECDGTALSPAEVFAAIKALTDHDRTALAKVARLYAPKTPYGHEDLLQEAFHRVLAGDRTWPRGVPALLLLAGVMRSIAWQWRRRDFASGEPAATSSTDAPQEWALLFDEVIRSFDDDPVARAVLLASLAGHKGKELLAVIEPILRTRGDASIAEAAIERELERALKKI